MRIQDLKRWILTCALFLSVETLYAQSVTVFWNISASATESFSPISGNPTAQASGFGINPVYNGKTNSVTPQYSSTCTCNYSITSFGAAGGQAMVFTNNTLGIAFKDYSSGSGSFSFPIVSGTTYYFVAYAGAVDDFQNPSSSASASLSYNIPAQPSQAVNGSASGNSTMPLTAGTHTLGSYSISWVGLSSGGSLSGISTLLTPSVVPPNGRVSVYLSNPNASSGSVMATFQNSAPSVTLTTPANGSGLAQSVPTFTFNYSDAEGDAQGTYETQIGTSSSFSVGTYYDSGTVSSSSHNFTLPAQNALSPNTVYYWRVQASDIYGASSGWTSAFVFTNTSAPLFNLTWNGTNLNNQSAISFPDLNQGTTTNITLTVSNLGTYPLVISSIQSSDPVTFPITSATLPITVSPAQGTALTVTFAPATLNHYSATLTIQDTDPTANPYVLNLQGNGIDYTFRYKGYLYQRTGPYLQGKLGSVSNYWGDVERAQAQARIQQYGSQIVASPTNHALWDRLLDTYYDSAEAEHEIAQEDIYSTLVYAMGFDPQNVGQPLISQQINQMAVAQQQFRRALTTLFPLLTNTFGIATATVDPTVTNGMPYGAYILQHEEANRPQVSPLLVGTNGTLYMASEAPGSAQPIVLANNYKDLGLWMLVEKEYAEASLNLARLYFSQGKALGTNGSAQLASAENVINSTLQSSYPEVVSVLGLFGLSITNLNTTGLPGSQADSINSWQVDINSLRQLELALNHNITPLGLPTDMLVLVQTPLPGGSSASLPSYDELAAYLISTSPQGPLTIALANWNTAQNSYTTYRESQDQLATQLTASQAQYSQQLELITGADPSNTNAYNNPFGNPASELAQEQLNLLSASNRLQTAQLAVTNLILQIQNAVAAAGAKDQIYNAMANITMSYGTSAGAIQAYIGSVQAQQVFIQNFQTERAQELANLQAAQGLAQDALTQMAAMQNATIYSLQGSVVDVDSATQIKTLMLQLESQALDALNAVIQVEIEQGKLAGLQSQQRELEMLRAENDATLANTYFADPTRRVQLDQALVQGSFSFQTCLTWMYLTVKALEYKWSLPFTTTYNGQQYTEATLFQCSNAQQLQNYYNAMTAWSASLAFGASSGTSDKFFSFRKDFLGIQGSGAPAVAAFQAYMTNPALVVAANDPSNLLQVRALRLNFSTAQETPSFFLPSRSLEKITYMGIKLLNASPTDPNQYYLDGYLYYAGTAYVRNLKTGSVDPNRPDHLLNDVSFYPVRWWYEDPTDGLWRSVDYFESYVPLQVTTAPSGASTSLQITAFKELSVAASRWTLYIALEDFNGNPISNLSNITDIEVHFSFNWFNRLPGP